MLSEIGYNPDVLSCLANLSSDEVFTPPELANRMLDLLPKEIWRDKNATFLDPGCKSGVFLREMTKRLDAGLSRQIPERKQRLNHIFKDQLFAIANTELTALLSRRSVYCSKVANGRYSVCDAFEHADGNVRFKRINHTWANGSCSYCGASQGAYDRGDGLETYAYELIHSRNPKEIFSMKFDVVIGNPPYQLGDDGHGSSATPIYQKFVESAISLNPRYIVMITPSRWFAGGKGLDGFRERMLKESRLRKLVDYPKLYDGFPGVKIRGGVSYFLWDRDYAGPCGVQTMWDGAPLGPPVARRLDAYDVLVRRNEAVSILDKVLAYRRDGAPEAKLSERISARKPFGLPTNFHGRDSTKGIRAPVKLYGSQRISYISRTDIPHNQGWINDWKVLISRVQGTSSAVEMQFLGRPIIARPGESCTETYLVAGRFRSEQVAKRYAGYLRTRFVRFLVSLRKNTQDAARGVYAFVPDVPFSITWTDDKLYERYGITKKEVAFIESVVRPMDEEYE
jgi:site-specific DNA-methyltransferase (adenine-specific)